MHHDKKKQLICKHNVYLRLVARLVVKLEGSFLCLKNNTKKIMTSFNKKSWGQWS